MISELRVIELIGHLKGEEGRVIFIEQSMRFTRDGG